MKCFLIKDVWKILDLSQGHSVVESNMTAFISIVITNEPVETGDNYGYMT